MLTEPEGQLWCTHPTLHVECTGVRAEDCIIPIGRGVQHDQEGAGRDRGTSHLDVNGGRAAEGLDGGHPPQYLLDGRGHYRQVLGQQRLLGRVASQGLGPSRQQRAGCFVACHQQGQQEPEHLALVEQSVADLSSGQHAQQLDSVRPGSADVVGQEPQQLSHAGGRLVGGPVGRLDGGIRPLPQLRHVGPVDAEQFGDHGDGDGCGQTVDQVDGLAGRRFVEGDAHDLSYAVLERRHRAGGEQPVDDRPVRSMEGWVDVKNGEGTEAATAAVTQRIVDEHTLARYEA